MKHSAAVNAIRKIFPEATKLQVGLMAETMREAAGKEGWEPEGPFELGELNTVRCYGGVVEIWIETASRGSRVSDGMLLHPGEADEIVRRCNAFPELRKIVQQWASYLEASKRYGLVGDRPSLSVPALLAILDGTGEETPRG